MSPLNVQLTDLINDIDTELADADALAKISEAQRRSRTLSDLGDQLVGHYVDEARSAGASWSQIGDAIGVSKQAAQQRWVPKTGPFDRFTRRARHVVVLAQETARNNLNGQIGPQHLLVGLLDDPEGLSVKIVEKLAGSTDRLREIAESLVAEGRGTGKAPKGHIPFDDTTKRILERSVTTAVELGHNYVGTEHLLLAFVIVAHEGRDAPVLDGLGLTVDAVRTQLKEELKGYLAEKTGEKTGE